MNYKEKGNQSFKTQQFGAPKTKLPFGFKVQNEKMELHKTLLSDMSMDAQINMRNRPDSAKMVATQNRIAQLVSQLNEPL